MNEAIVMRPVGRIETKASGGRRRRVLKGELMCTPVERLIHNDPYRGRCVMEPGRDRVSIDHRMVAENPELFVPCWKDDRITADRMRGYLDRALKDEQREIARMGGSRRVAARPRTKLWRLPSDEGGSPWRLP